MKGTRSFFMKPEIAKYSGKCPKAGVRKMDQVSLLDLHPSAIRLLTCTRLALTVCSD